MKNVTFENVPLEASRPDFTHSIMTLTRTAGEVTEIQIMPPPGKVLSIILTPEGSLHIAISKKPE